MRHCAGLVAVVSTISMLALPAADVLRSRDQGAFWEALLFLRGRVRAILVDPADPRQIYVGAERLPRGHGFGTTGVVYHSADGGLTWTFAALAGARPPVVSLAADPLVPHGVLAGTSGAVFASSDRGATWQLLGGPLPPARVVAIAADPFSPARLYVATSGARAFVLAGRAKGDR
jgi:photosystem II stability/assembly factor-like uncharacterized protein